ncbi:hypothetical protein GOP47_0018191 [Adiantum capillus-veneris]|uniref:Uncharacterized protein n=1 Tax=Adiantum capillus-veneris TaxID=13818 RepID=A0A9D4UGT5_ADICA|nr:hypothetical protein GOP47_0018191 [Adiantum capillus-veneris]
MIEAPEDRLGGNEVTNHGSELATWENLCMSLRFSDVWHHEGFARERDSLLFTRSGRRIGGTNLSHIDRMYISDMLGDRGGSIGIMAGTCMSDHFLVVLVLAVGDRCFSQSLRIPQSVQIDESLAERVEEIWKLSQDSLGREPSVLQRASCISVPFSVESAAHTDSRDRA